MAENEETPAQAGGGDWFNTGFDSLDDEEKWQPQYDDSDQGPRRVWMPNGKTNRLLWLDDNPFCFWEQQFKFGEAGWRNWLVHLSRNNIAPVHPMDAVFPPGDKGSPSSISFVGYTTVLNLTGYEKGGKRVAFYREMHGAKAGTKKNPGVLHKMRRLKKKHGTLVGLVFDIMRVGENSPSSGNDFDLIEKVPVHAEAYAKFLKLRNEALAEGDDDKLMDARKAYQYAMTKVLEYLKKQGYTEDTVPVPYVYSQVFEPMSVENMQKLADQVQKARTAAGIGGGGAGSDVGYTDKTKAGGWGDGGGSGGSSKSGGDDPDFDEDMPF
jgi:hypothetical protein